MSERKVYVRTALAKAVRTNLPNNKDDFTKIGDPLRSNGQGNILGTVDEILDLVRGQFQDEIYAKVKAALDALSGGMSGYQKKLTAGNIIAINTIVKWICHRMRRRRRR